MEESIQEIPQGGVSVKEVIQLADQVIKATQPLAIIPQPPSWIPPKVIKRNEHGLIENFNYKYTEEGLIDWRSLINPKFLVPNKQNFEKKGKVVPNSIAGLDDRDLLILLQGIKEISAVRGFYSVDYNIVSPNENFVVACCRITWIPNFETEGNPVTFSALGDASPQNTTAFGKFYLAACAENRAFVRAVRNFLKINIVSQEEMGPLSSESNTVDTSSEKLAITMDECNVSFEQIREKLILEKREGAENYKKISDIPRVLQFELISRLKKKALKKA